MLGSNVLDSDWGDVQPTNDDTKARHAFDERSA
jgi:hypothetical protein